MDLEILWVIYPREFHCLLRFRQSLEKTCLGILKEAAQRPWNQGVGGSKVGSQSHLCPPDQMGLPTATSDVSPLLAFLLVRPTSLPSGQLQTGPPPTQSQNFNTSTPGDVSATVGGVSWGSFGISCPLALPDESGYVMISLICITVCSLERAWAVFPGVPSAGPWEAHRTVCSINEETLETSPGPEARETQESAEDSSRGSPNSAH